jgi:AraC-like DNA-binding protein
MIVVQVTDPYLRKAVLRAARLEEDVITEGRLAADALEWGFPRLVVRDQPHRRPPLRSNVPVLELDDELLRRWDAERRAKDLPPTRLDHVTACLVEMMDWGGSERTWVDATLADLSRAAGRRVPMPLRAFGRRILEFPFRYTSLHPLAEACGTSRGALKARFRRRGLSSPSTYLRWFRILAVARVLSDREVTVAAAAPRLGFTSDGNLCRMLWKVAAVTPTEVRTVRGWNRLLVSFGWQFLSPDALEGWASLDELFDRRVA